MTCKVIKSYEKLRRQYVRSISSKHALSNKWGLAPKQLMFAMHYADAKSPGFLNARKALKLSGYTGTSIESYGKILLRTPRVTMALKELLGTDRIDTLIQQGVERRLENHESRNWQSTADFVAKVRGDFAPEKTINMNMTPDDRDKKYEEILKLVEKGTKNANPEARPAEIRSICMDAPDKENAVSDMRLSQGTDTEPDVA